MSSYIDIEIILVAFVSKQGVAFGYHIGGDEFFKSLKLFCLAGKAPGFEVKIKLEFIHYKLPEAHQFFIAVFVLEFFEAIKLSPLPDNRAHNISQNQA